MKEPVQDIYPIVPNPYILLDHFCIRLTGHILCILLDAMSQELSSFGWQDPNTHHKFHYYWIILPKVFKYSSTIFREILSMDPTGLQLKKKVLKYMDDILTQRLLITPLTF